MPACLARSRWISTLAHAANAHVDCNKPWPAHAAEGMADCAAHLAAGDEDAHFLAQLLVNGRLGAGGRQRDGGVRLRLAALRPDHRAPPPRNVRTRQAHVAARWTNSWRVFCRLAANQAAQAKHCNKARCGAWPQIHPELLPLQPIVPEWGHKHATQLLMLVRCKHTAKPNMRHAVGHVQEKRERTDGERI